MQICALFAIFARFAVPIGIWGLEIGIWEFV
jgi:hypothetical protein